MSLQTVQVFLTLWNLFTISIITRYFIYNKGLNFKILGSILIYIFALNFQLYINKYLAIILILYLTYISFYSIKEALSININFNRFFTDIVFINKANYLARGNIIGDAEEFVREISAEKNRRSSIFKNINLKNPLI